MELNINNYETYLLRYVDGELDPAEMKAVNAFLEQHPSCKQELDLLQMTKLTPEDKIVFPAKPSLYRKETRQKKKAWLRPRYGWISSAVAAAALIAVLFLHPWTPTTERNAPIVVEVSQPAARPVPVTPSPVRRTDSALHAGSSVNPQPSLAVTKAAKKIPVPTLAVPVTRSDNGAMVHRPDKQALQSLPSATISTAIRQAAEPVVMAGISTPKPAPSAASVPEKAPKTDRVLLETKINKASETLALAKNDMDETISDKLEELHHRTSGFFEKIQKKGLKIGNVTFAINN